MTDLSPGQTMAGMVRLGRAFASVLVVFGVLTSTWATCVEGAAATPIQQMACCKAGHDHCPMKDSASDCCKKSGPQIESQATIAKAASLSAAAPVPVPLAWMILPAGVSTANVQGRVSYHSSPPGLVFAPPAYIAFSSLLI